MKILITDDEITSRKKLEFLTTKLGYEVLSAIDGQKAWEIWQKEKPRLVITDWIMPVMDGLELIKKIRAEEDQLYTFIVLVTSQGSRDSLIEGMKAGADDYITKPFNKEELMVRIKSGERMITLQNEQLQRSKLETVLEMAGTICHEFNQPLQIMHGNCDLALEEFSYNPGFNKYIQNLMSQVKRMANLTDKLAGITKYKTKDYLNDIKIIDLD